MRGPEEDRDWDGTGDGHRERGRERDGDGDGDGDTKRGRGRDRERGKERERANEDDVEELRGPALVAWLAANTEKLVVVAGALDGKAADLAPGVPVERVLDLCRAVRHAALEITVAMLALLSKADGPRADGALAEAVANAHARLQQREG